MAGRSLLIVPFVAALAVTAARPASMQVASATAPSVLFSTRIAGAQVETPFAVAVDADGPIYVAGTTSSPDLPTTPDAFQRRLAAAPDAFLAKLDLHGRLLYLTYLGGSRSRSSLLTSVETISGLAVDSQGVTVAGTTSSTDFPTVNGLQSQPQATCCTDGFIARFDRSLTRLIFSTYFGGTDGSTAINALVRDPSGQVYVAGTTDAWQFPATRVLGTGALGPRTHRVFVARLNPAGGLTYATRFGSVTRPFDRVTALTVDVSGQAVVTGLASGSDFPLSRPAFPNCLDPCNAGFLSKLNTSGSDFVFSTFLQPDGPATPSDLQTDAVGRSYVSGAQNDNALIAQYGPTGTAGPVTRFGPGVSGAIRFVFDLAGRIHLTGNTASPNLPVVNPLLAAHPQGPVLASDDGGGRWQAASRGILEGARAFAFDASGAIWTGAGTRLARSTDGGASWQPASSIPFSSITSIATDPRDPSLIYAIDGVERRISRSHDSGQTWTTLPLPDMSNIETLVIDPSDSRTLYAGGIGGIRKSTDGGITWTSADAGLTFRVERLWVFSLVIDPASPSTIYAATRDTVFKSRDGGRSWVPSGNGLSASSISIALALDPFVRDTLYAAVDRALFRSTDGGVTWTAANSGLPALHYTSIAPDPRVPRVLYVAAVSAGPDSVFRTADRGVTWQRRSAGIVTNSVRALTVDPRSGRLFAAVDTTSVPFVARLSTGDAGPLLSTYLPWGQNPLVALDPAGQIVLAFSGDGDVVVQRLVLVDQIPSVPRCRPVVWDAPQRLMAGCVE